MGRKSESERFAGAVNSYSIEAMMGDTRALQAGTSHYLGENFARAFEIQYLNRENSRQYVSTTSWGLSTRVVGAIIMVHGDDQGLVLPPRLAPFQVVIVPIHKNEEQKGVVLEQTEVVRQALGDFRVKVDDREEVTAGFKFNDWEMRGVPLRIEIGPKDVEQHQVTLSRRDEKGRSSAPVEGVAEVVQATLDEIQANMLAKAREFMRENTHDPADYAEFQEVVKTGWADVWWCGRADCEAEIKQETKATNRAIPLDQPGGEGVCIHCGNPATERAIFARAY